MFNGMECPPGGRICKEKGEKYCTNNLGRKFLVKLPRALSVLGLRPRSLSVTTTAYSVYAVGRPPLALARNMLYFPKHPARRQSEMLYASIAAVEGSDRMQIKPL